VEAAAAPFQQAAGRKEIGFDVNRPAGPLLVWFDPDHIDKVLANLLSNAIKFTPPGGAVRVTVSRKGHSARVEVRDSGPGIPAPELAHVFDRFHRVDESSTRAQPGTGIGLSLAKELVDLHAGTLSVSSEEGFGSTFVVSLPLGRSHLAPDQLAGDEGGPAGIERLPHIADTAGDGLPGPAAVSALDEREDVTTVLVVDDNAEVRAYVRRHLEPAYRVLEAANGAQGVALAHSALPDLIVSDVMMPDVDGLELCRMLKSDRETGFIPIVLLTAKAAPEDRIEGLREHCDDYLTKPFDPVELLARIQNLIDQRRRLLASYGPPPGAAGARDLQAAGLHPDHVDPDSADAVFLERVRECIEGHIADEAFSVERLAADVGLSRAHLHRRLRDLLSQTPSDLIRRMRLERAAELLGARAGSVSEVAYAVGFKSVAHFSNAFNAHYGCRPSAYPGALEGEPG
jgi:DNA-binding response OmpR family regulator